MFGQKVSPCLQELQSKVEVNVVTGSHKSSPGSRLWLPFCINTILDRFRRGDIWWSPDVQSGEKRALDSVVTSHTNLLHKTPASLPTFGLEASAAVWTLRLYSAGVQVGMALVLKEKLYFTCARTAVKAVTLESATRQTSHKTMWKAFSVQQDTLRYRRIGSSGRKRELILFSDESPIRNVVIFADMIVLRQHSDIQCRLICLFQ